MTPHDHETERMLLGLCLLESVKLADAARLLGPADFHRPEHQAVFDLLVREQSAGRPTDLVSVAERVVRLGLSERVGGLGYFAELPDHAVSSALDVYALVEVVRDRATRRALLAEASLLGQLCRAETPRLEDGAEAPTDAGAIGQLLVHRLSLLSAPPRRIEWTLAEAANAQAQAREAARASGRPQATPTGLDPLDAQLNGGLRPGELVVVGGSTGMGKTSLAKSIALGVARSSGPVGYLLLEQHPLEFADSMISTLSRIPLGSIRRGDLGAQGQDLLARWREALASWPVRLAYMPGARWAELAAQIRRWVLVQRVEVVVLDYLQLVKHDRAERHDLAVGGTSKACKLLAAELGVTVVLLSQLNRGFQAQPGGGSGPRRPEQPTGGPWWGKVQLPRTADLRDSGQIEQDADVILFPVRASEVGLPDMPRSAACCVVAKQRNGPTGVVPLLWHGETASYEAIPVPGAGS